MPFQLLSKSACQQLISHELKDGKKNPNSERVFIFCVVDCAIVNGKPVVYEVQYPINSGIGKKSFFKLMEGFEDIYFNAEWSPFAGKIRGQDQEYINIIDIEDVKNFHVVTLVNTSKTNKTLFLFDVKGRSYRSLPNSSMKNMLKFGKSFNKKNIYWSSSDADFGPHESLFHSKFLQRLIMSNSGLTPEFTFFEKKSFYTTEDINMILNALNLSGGDRIVIKKDHGSTDNGNLFISSEKLQEYLNSEEFRKNHKSEDVILIEKFTNEKKQDGYYHTERYAFSLCDDNVKSLKIYKMIHRNVSSHKLEEWSWYDENENELKDEVTQKLFSDSLKTIRDIDYLSLLETLLNSKNDIEILIALDVISYNYPMLYIDYDAEVNKDEIKNSKANISLKMSKTMFDLFESLLSNKNLLVRKRVAEILDKIAAYLDIEIVSRFTGEGTKIWNNVTNPSLMAKLNALFDKANALLVVNQNKNVICQTNNTVFWSQENSKQEKDEIVSQDEHDINASTQLL